ncbi:TPA: hypothetical protein ACGY72_001751 [Stenotrophomonas maltophilia]
MQTFPCAYVQQADGNTVQVVLVDTTAQPALRALGFAGVPPVLHAPVANDAAKARMFAALRDLGVAFSAGREWCPAEVFGWLRECGLLEGPCLRIAWTGRQQFQLTQP